MKKIFRYGTAVLLLLLWFPFFTLSASAGELEEIKVSSGTMKLSAGAELSWWGSLPVVTLSGGDRLILQNLDKASVQPATSLGGNRLFPKGNQTVLFDAPTRFKSLTQTELPPGLSLVVLERGKSRVECLLANGGGLPEGETLSNSPVWIQKGWNEVTGDWYYFGADGAAHTGWLTYGGGNYFLDNRGKMKTGWVSDGGNWYYLDASGRRAAGWLFRSGDYYYLDASTGVMRTGWVANGGKWYYLDSSGRMLRNQFVGKYRLTADGSMARTDFSLSAVQKNQLDQMLKAYHGTVSVVFEDLDSGYFYRYQPDKRYFVASLYKAPYALWLYQQADAGKVDRNKKIALLEEDREEGAGILREVQAGTEFTVGTLLNYMIRYSDNTALHMLTRQFPMEDFAAAAAGWGLSDSKNVKTYKTGRISAGDGAVYARLIYEYLESASPNAKVFGEDLKTTQYKPIPAGKWDVAQKYGLWKDAFHVMAVVYGPHPYTLTVCTALGDGESGDETPILEIAAYFEEIMSGK